MQITVYSALTIRKCVNQMVCMETQWWQSVEEWVVINKMN